MNASSQEIRPLQLDEGVVAFPVRTPTLPPATHTNAYVIGTAEFLVVEPASPHPEEQEALWQYLRQRLDAGDRCRAIVLTHHHPDHVGGLAALREALPVPVWTHRETARLLEGVAFDRLLEEGEVIELASGDGRPPRRVEVFHTPGHAPGHLCLLDRSTGACAVGDMVAGVGWILIDPYDGDMIQYLDSLRRMATLGIRTLLPAHGPPMAEPESVLERYIEHRLLRERKIEAALAQHPDGASIDRLLPAAYDDTPEFLYPLAARALQSHLRKLVVEGRASQPEPDLYVALR